MVSHVWFSEVTSTTRSRTIRRRREICKIANEHAAMNRRIANRQKAMDSAEFSTKTKSILITRLGAVLQLPKGDHMKKVVLG